MTRTAHKTDLRTRTKTMQFYPFVFIGKDPCKGWRGVLAEFDEAIPLKTFKYNEQHDEKNTDARHHSYYAYDHAGGSCGSRAQSELACFAETEQFARNDWESTHRTGVGKNFRRGLQMSAEFCIFAFRM